MSKVMINNFIRFDPGGVTLVVPTPVNNVPFIERPSFFLLLDVFFGPICDYVIAPIARYNSVWGIPILTTGGLTDAFSIKPSYPTLTRMMGSYSDTGLAVREIRRHFNWTVQAFIYHDNDENKGKGHSDCSMAISSIFRALNTTDYFSHNFDETETSYKDYLQFLTKTKRKARSKWNQTSLYL